MLNLDDIISSLEGLEIKRALAVKMLVHNFKTKEVTTPPDIHYSDTMPELTRPTQPNWIA
ncbi:MAG: hypothetical protein IPL59_04495 [Candidatus Competibacteraceae bacterium]|nr:hypothetical protein [Candidatus Competibacteraceae bacterium]